MNKIFVFLLIFMNINTLTYSQPSDSSVVSMKCEKLEVESQNISGLYLTQTYIDSLNLKISNIHLSFHYSLFSKGIKRKYAKLLKEEHCLYSETKAIIEIDEKIIKRKIKKKKALSKINMGHIKMITFLNKKEAKKKYGWWKGRHGAIIIETKEIE